MERRSFAADLFALVSPALESRGFLAAFTERTGGASASPYDSLNLGLHTGDDRAAVVSNRERVASALGVPPFAALRQVHGSRLVRLGERKAGAGFSDEDAPAAEADAALVTRPGLPLAILTADCVPVAIASEAEGCFVAAHAGWRGLAAGIVDRAMGAFEHPGRAAAAIGPAIGPCHYEVGEDVALAVAAGSDAGAVVEPREGAVFLDLPGTVARVLRRAGVRTIDRADECTACEEARFFSHRRDGVTGRQAMVVARR